MSVQADTRLRALPYGKATDFSSERARAKLDVDALLQQTKELSSAASAATGIGGSGFTADSAAPEYSAGALLSSKPGGIAHCLDQLEHRAGPQAAGHQQPSLKDLDLPGIAVIGGQNAGKSSVAELLSGISPPRHACLP